MAFQIIRVCRIVSKHNISSRVWSTGLLQNDSVNRVLNAEKLQQPITNSIRNTSFFSKRKAEDLWKGVTTVSNAGRKRGRGKTVSKKLMKNLNRGQVIGIGKINMAWPGLTQPIMRGRELVEQQRLPDDPERDAKLIKMRDSMIQYKRERVSPLDRGWSGGKPGGRKLGPPDPVGEETFEDFDTRILEYKMVAHMTGNLGRKRVMSAFVITGNSNGLAGIALSKASEGKAALRSAKNRAASKLMYIPRYNSHTVIHDFFTQFGKTKIYVTKKNEGYGLVCHRAIKTCCEVIGIKDLHAKVEGSTNLKHIIKAFLIGLLRQKTMQEIADEKKLHVVELNRENDFFPTVVASPHEVRNEKEIESSEVLDFKQYVMGGKVILQRKKYPPFYTKHQSWTIRQRKQVYLRDKDDTRIRMYAEHGELKSFLTDKYPEARPNIWKKKPPVVEEVEEE